MAKQVRDEAMMPMWAATLCVAVLLLVIAGILVAVGRSKLRDVQFRPTAAVENVKQDLRAIRTDFERRREGKTDAG